MYKIIDLFCGIGGFSYGFEMTKSYKTILGVDFWDVALDTFKLNHPSTEIRQGDIRNLTEEFFSKYVGNIDVIIAGPPCQGFSMSGKREVLDERNNLFTEVVRIVNIVKPKVVVIENVLGLLSMRTPKGEQVKDIIVKELEMLGYTVGYKVLTASEHGVPQNRKRVIFIASLMDNVIFPIPQYGSNGKSIVTVGDAIGNIPNEGEYYLKSSNEYQVIMSGRNDIINHEPIKHSSLIEKRMKSVPQGGNWMDIPLELGQGGGKHSNNYRRLKIDEPAITIKHVSKSMIIHPIYDRTPTIREVARIQSFNDDFVLTGAKYDQHQQLANAVPPILGKVIAETVLEMLRDFDA